VKVNRHLNRDGHLDGMQAAVRVEFRLMLRKSSTVSTRLSASRRRVTIHHID